MTYPVKEFNGQYFAELYLPARTAVVLKEVTAENTPIEKKKTTRKAAAKKTAETVCEEKPVKKGNKKESFG